MKASPNPGEAFMHCKQDVSSRTRTARESQIAAATNRAASVRPESGVILARPYSLGWIMSRRILVLTAALIAAALIGPASADGVTYTYDELGRVETVTITVTGQPTKVITYTYDDAGNITAIAVTP
jgi:hypothetical protein